MSVYTEFPGDEIVAVHFKSGPPEPPEPPEVEEPEDCGVIVRPYGPQLVGGSSDWIWNFIGNFELNRVYFYDPAWVPEEDLFPAAPNYWFVDGAVAYEFEWVVEIETRHSNPAGAPIHTVTIPYQNGIAISAATRPGPVGTPGFTPSGPPLVAGPPVSYELDLRDFDGVQQSVYLAALYAFTSININSTPAPPQGWDNNVEWTTAGSYLRITAKCIHDEARGGVVEHAGPLLRTRRG